MAKLLTARQRERRDMRGVRFGEKIISAASTQAARADEATIAARIRRDNAAGIPWQPFKPRPAGITSDAWRAACEYATDAHRAWNQ